MDGGVVTDSGADLVAFLQHRLDAAAGRCRRRQKKATRHHFGHGGGAARGEKRNGGRRFPCRRRRTDESRAFASWRSQPCLLWSGLDWSNGACETPWLLKRGVLNLEPMLWHWNRTCGGMAGTGSCQVDVASSATATTTLGRLESRQVRPFFTPFHCEDPMLMPSKDCQCLGNACIGYHCAAGSGYVARCRGSAGRTWTSPSALTESVRANSDVSSIPLWIIGAHARCGEGRYRDAGLPQKSMACGRLKCGMVCAMVDNARIVAQTAEQRQRSTSTSHSPYNTASTDKPGRPGICCWGLQ